MKSRKRRKSGLKKRAIAAVLAAVLFITAMSNTVCASPILGFAVDPKIQIHHFAGGTVSFSSLSAAIDASVDGDTVTLAGEVANYTTSSGVTVTKNITFEVGKDFGGSKKYLRYSGTSAPLFTVENGGVLTVTDSVIYGCDSSLPCGGFARVKKGGTLVLDGKTGDEVTIRDFRLGEQDSKGGAIYVEQGGKVIVNGVTFENNSSAEGADIYAEQKTDVTVKDGVIANYAHGESVDTNGLHLILSGEIGLVFHTEVPEKYTGGSFVLSSRTGETVKYSITECEKDKEGRYLAKYDLSAVELSEPVTLTVCDINGDAITAKTVSAEEYGATVLAGEDATKAEKDVVRALLNYGHYVQIECTEYDGLTPGEDYTVTAKYADLTTADSAFDGYSFTLTGDYSGINSLLVSLSPNYKTDMNLYFEAENKPTVKVNGEEAVVTETEFENCGYAVFIKGIGVLDLAKEFTVEINGEFTLTLSALSYCKLIVENNSENAANAVKALFEFYKAAVKYNTDPISSESD